jgi:hypothetical protein
MFHVLYGGPSGLSVTGDQAFDLDDPSLPGGSLPDDYFSQAMAAGDFDGDGNDDLAVSAPGSAIDDLSPGGVFTLYGTSNGFLDHVDYGSTPTSVSESGGTFTISVRRTGSLILPLHVTIVIRSTGTATRGTDFADFSGSALDWVAGEGGTKTVTFSLFNDFLDEPDETIVFGLDASSHCEEPADFSLTLLDNDVGGNLHFSTADYSVAENAGMATITVQRSAGAASNVGVHFATANGSARAPGDYPATSGDLTFAQNETQKTFQVPIVLADDLEGAETFTVTLSAPSGGAVLDAPLSATVTVTNVKFGIFADGFESQDTARWGQPYP